ncbi:hypothetical protein H6F78_06025 [Coleofasciculus sp. FACHB-64]|jgi:hypothetical protein|uniref:hypothetical protein n=1 Tax=Cyanophyceae TaxID=3028117 RepID=UPI001684DCBC|nr:MULTISPECIES: hypothetical protein [unclassified Coleofasciculus]MBD1840703.1 hypothetical protein [Coleofasciculus sp. FACHB-501]MBD1879921.1 hypothetical protein [Coleofasciculus sp. FACHB-T130]MBD1890294.1 hypothetical protein [Coleofasciculus sp. FACHB-SPT9]MBD1899637.1 hypothetical protein [Coleofasciculus sp. FACHB-125]MBD1942616.1 hypothetical protein [Coleofasciculus sp. FACHB-712]
MAWTRERQSNLQIQQMVDRILSAGQLTRSEYLHLTTAILSDYLVTDEERRQLNRIFDNIQTGHLKFVD